MKHHHLSLALFSLALAAVARAEPPAYVAATAHYILPETTSEESGYFSLSESLDGAIHVGTAKYNANALLVEFDPRTGRQRIVLDTHKTCGLTATGYAAQAKLHTRNFVGPSGKVYVGSKQGYAAKGDTQAYPGGYAMTYDPRADRAVNLGMPMAGQGVIDIVADEARAKLYVVTCEEQHWMLGTLAGAPWRELGPLLTPYAMTLVDSRGVASAITKDFELAQFDPATDRVTTRPIVLNSQPWKRANNSAIPTWQIDPDGRHAWLILMNDPTLLRIDLHSAGAQVTAESRGLLIDGENPDSRCALTIHPDGKIYALVRVANTTGFGTGMLHHLVRHDPATNRNEDLGVLKVQNPDFFDWSPGADGKAKPWTHGFHKLPDGTLTPLHAHMGLIAARDGTLYATVLYPYTLLKIDAYKVALPAPTPAAKYLGALDRKLGEAAARLPEITQLAEQLAERHVRGGLIGFPWIGSTLEQELIGRSGGLMHIGLERPWKKERTAEEKANDAMIFAWDDAPKAGDLKRLQEAKAKGLFIIGFGAKKSAKLADLVAACDAWIDSGTTEDDRAVELSGGRRIGKTEHFTNGVNGWLFTAEFVAALTRRGNMPPMYRSWMAEDGRAWSDRYAGKMQFHNDLNIAPVAAGVLSRRYLDRVRYMVARMKSAELAKLQTVAERIAAELHEGRKTVVASIGHMVMNYVGRFDDSLWATNHEVSPGADSQLKSYEKTPNGALVLRLDANGLHGSIHELFKRKQQRVMLITSENPRAEAAIPAGYDLRVDPGIPFGDACVWIDGYPIPILPPSGVMQIAAYESINVEVHARQAAP
jgi:hypothetical protein